MFCNQNQLAREIRWFSRMRIEVDGIAATPHDRNQFISASILRYGLCSDLLPDQSWDNCVYRRCLHNLDYLDIKLYAKDMKTVKQFYISSLSDPSGMPWHDFKRHVCTRIQYKWILTMLERVYSSTGAAIQWLSFDERLQTDTNSDISAEIASYVEFEEDLSHRSYDTALLDELNSIIIEWFRDYEPAFEFPIGKFGPGATSELGRASMLEKMEQFSSDPTIRSLFVQMYYRHSEEFLPDERQKFVNRMNRIIFVPKNALKHRIISAEPTWLTWYQQILKDSMYTYIENAREMHTRFSNQEVSRMMALLSSIDCKYATIDFSSASDSITCDMVAKMWHSTPLADMLLGTRSHYGLLPNGSVIPLSKFAPMGSATCFAVMDCTFLSICELAVRRVKGKRSSIVDYVVYGDDVIIKCEYLDHFMSICKELSLGINLEKSFATDSGRVYRESCGMEACNGVDITPLRYSRFQEPILSNAPISNTFWGQTIDLINSMMLSGYYEMRSACIELIKFSTRRGSNKRKKSLSQSIWNHTLRIDEYDYRKGTDGSNAIIVPNGTATNYRSKTRYNPDLQRLECRVITPRIVDNEYYDSSSAYELWFIVAERTEHLYGVDERGIPYHEGPILKGCSGAAKDHHGWSFAWVGLT